MADYKTVTVTVKMKMIDDQPVVDWFPDMVQEQLRSEDGEELISYTDDEKWETDNG